MPRISLAFFSVAALCGLSGMIWGTIMAASENHITAPAHAHLNLLGWVTLSLMGGFYALRGRPAGRLAWVNLALSATGAIIMAPLLGLLLSGHEKGVGPFMPIPDTLCILGMAVFVFNVLTTWRAPKAA